MHQLIPFENSSQNSLFHVSAKIQRDSSSSGLALEFLVKGPIQTLKLPELVKASGRADNLWQSTCFEAFLSANQSSDSSYFEINLAPDGQWNFYQLTSYRQNLSPVQNIHAPLVKTEESEFQYRLTATWENLPPELTEQTFHVGLTVILHSEPGEKSYWALAHKSPQADFHNKESFTVIV